MLQLGNWPADYSHRKETGHKVLAADTGDSVPSRGTAVSCLADHTLVGHTVHDSDRGRLVLGVQLHSLGLR